MRRIFATLLLMIVCSLILQGQSSTQQPTNTPPNPGDSSSSQAQPGSTPQPSDTPSNPTDANSKSLQPPSAPSTPDATAPNQDAQADSSSNHKQSAVKRKLKELTPGCLNVGAYQKCRSSKDSTKTSKQSSPDKEFAEDIEVGDFYFERKNYNGAMLRYKDALERKPSDPQATFKLARALEALHQADEARQDYAVYLKLDPSGHYAKDARKALDRLQATSADKVK